MSKAQLVMLEAIDIIQQRLKEKGISDTHIKEQLNLIKKYIREV